MTSTVDVDLDERPIPAIAMWLAAIAVLAFVLRAARPDFNTAFEDESFMILMGRSVLARAPDVGMYMRTAFGWYLWPVTAALADKLGGLVAVRLVAGALGTLATLGMYAFGRSLFDARAGLLTATLFAVVTPAILTAKIATHDALAVPLLVASLALYARAWRTDDVRAWIGAAVLCFATFTVKHPLAAIFPAMCIVALIVGRWRGLVFCALLTACVAAYAAIYWDVVRALLVFVRDFNAFRAPDIELARIYFRDRLDLWSIVVLSAIAFGLGTRRTRLIALAVSATAACFAYAHVSRRLDYHTWKHAVYPIVLLLPVASVGALRLMNAIARRDQPLVALLGASLAFTLHLFGRQGLVPDDGGVPFRWPDAREVVAFVEPRLHAGQRVLLDDAAMRYPLGDALAQTAMTDVYWFEYGGARGADAYAAAIRDGYFDYVVLVGADGGAATALHRAIDAGLADRYAIRYETDQPSTGKNAAVFERVAPPVTRRPGESRLVIDSPREGAVVIASGAPPRADVVGRVEPAADSLVIAVDVLTDRWYPQATAVRPTAAGAFRVPVLLAGTGNERCHHVIRVRLATATGRIVDETTLSDVVRSTADSVGVPCPAP